LKSGITTIAEMDSQMVDLQKVFLGTRGELKMLKQDMMASSIEMGSLTGETMKAAIELGRMGKTRSEISSLVEASLLAQNIAEMEAGDATRYLNAAVLQFNKNATDAITILDQWNYLSNTTPSRTIDFAQAVSIAGSTVANAGGNIEDLNAWVATLTATTAKSGDEIGQAIKTITSYSRREQTVAKLARITGIAVEDEAGQYKNIQDVLAEVAGAWDGLRDAQKEELAQSMAGVRRKNFFLALMNNFNLVIDAHAKQWRAAGSAYQENEIRLSSLKTKIQQMEAAMERIAIQGGDAGLLGAMKKTVDILRYLATAFGDANGAMQLAATAGIPAAIYGLEKLSKQLAKANILTNLATGKFIYWAGAIGALIGVSYGLSKALESETTRLREQRKELEENIERTRIMIEQQKAIVDQYDQFKKQKNIYDNATKGSQKAQTAEENLKKVLGEIQDLHPELIQSTDDYAAAELRLAEAAKKAGLEIATQTEKITRQTIAQKNSLLRESELKAPALRRDVIESYETSKYVPGERTRIKQIVPTDLSQEWDRQLFEIEKKLSATNKPLERQKILQEAVNQLTGKLNRLLAESGNKQTKQTKALDAYIDNLGTRLNLTTEIVNEEAKLSGQNPPGSGAPSDPYTDPDMQAKLYDEKEKHLLEIARLNNKELEYWQTRLRDESRIADDLERKQIENQIEILQLQDKIARRKEGESYALEMARLNNKELEYWQEYLDIHKEISALERQEIQNNILLLIEKRDIKKMGEATAESEKELEERTKATSKAIKDRKKAYEKLQEVIRDTNADIAAAKERADFKPSYDITQRGSWALLEMEDYYKPIREAQAKLTGMQKTAGREMYPENKWPGEGWTGEMALGFLEENKTKITEAEYKKYSDIIGNIIKAEGELTQAQINQKKTIEDELQLEYLRQTLLGEELKFASDQQIIDAERQFWLETNVDETVRKLELEKLTTREMELQVQRQTELAQGIIDTMNNLVENWQAGKAGKEVGAEFAQGIGETLGKSLSEKLGEVAAEQIGGTVGNLIGNAILPGIGGAVGGALFSWLGKEIFDWEDKKSEAEELAESTDENTNALRENTQAFRDFTEQLYNAPAGFSLQPAARQALPEFANEGIVTRTGYAKVDSGETVINNQRLQRLLEQGGGTQTLTSNSYANTSNIRISKIEINNPRNDFDVQRSLEKALNKTYGGGMRRGANVSTRYTPN
jgi:TP901 family phage tail tape measure protein